MAIKINKHLLLSSNHRTAFSLSMIIGFMLAFFSLVGTIFSEKSYNLSKVLVYNIIVHFAVTILVLFILYEFCFWAFRRTRIQERKRHLVALLGIFGLTILISPVFSYIELYLFRPFGADLRLNQFIVFNLIVDLVLSFIVFLSTLTVVIVIHNQQMLLENQQLYAENLRNRFEALKSQLNPHFLFNTLNTLDGLIGFDNEKAHLYLHNLSSSFRYTIQSKGITTLKEELDVVESYAYLMKIRYGDNFDIQYAINVRYNNFYIMPLSLQLLIENAIKHNVINDKHPLTIHISTTENESIKVTNLIQPKIKIETGEGIGLANLIERYRLLFDKEVLVTQNDFFGIEIPLIEHIHNIPEIEIEI